MNMSDATTLANDETTLAKAAVANAAEVDTPRQCGRCRGFFDDAATRGLPERDRWWLCPACSEILLPESRHRS